MKTSNENLSRELFYVCYSDKCFFLKWYLNCRLFAFHSYKIYSGQTVYKNKTEINVNAPLAYIWPISVDIKARAHHLNLIAPKKKQRTSVIN